MGLLKAKEKLLLGERIPAHECVEIGLANRVVPDADLMTEAMALAERLAAQPPQAQQETKRAINLHVQHAIAMVAPFALSAESESFATDDVKHTIETFKTRSSTQ
jgi:enoyl-CoA hydratase/carnithine racemase